MMKLIFIYNVKSGAISSFINTAHKIISPETYQCSLCKLTHGDFSEKKEWRRFRESLSVQVEFHHSNEYNLKGKEIELPVVLFDEGDRQKVLITAEKLNQLKNVNDLIEEIQGLI